MTYRNGGCYVPISHTNFPITAAVVSLASSLGGISTNNSTSNSALGDATTGGSGSSSTTVGSSGRTTCVCGIRFSSPSNLEAHRMFYCTHRPNLHSGVWPRAGRRLLPETCSI